MRVQGRRVYFTEQDWRVFFRGFPGAAQQHIEAHGFFEFAPNGDLMKMNVLRGRSKRDLSHDFDGYELVAFSNEAQSLLHPRGSKSLARGRSAGSAGALATTEDVVTMSSKKHTAALAMAAAVGALAGAGTMHVAHRRGWM